MPNLHKNQVDQKFTDFQKFYWIHQFHFRDLAEGQDWIVADIDYRFAELLKNVNRIAKEIKADVAQTNKKLDSLGSNIGQMKKPSHQSIWD